MMFLWSFEVLQVSQIIMQEAKMLLRDWQKVRSEKISHFHEL